MVVRHEGWIAAPAGLITAPTGWITGPTGWEVRSVFVFIAN